jgi:hypothetical protein
MSDKITLAECKEMTEEVKARLGPKATAEEILNELWFLLYKRAHIKDERYQPPMRLRSTMWEDVYHLLEHYAERPDECRQSVREIIGWKV